MINDTEHALNLAINAAEHLRKYLPDDEKLAEADNIAIALLERAKQLRVGRTMVADFDSRRTAGLGNLLFSYDVAEDKLAAEAHGYEFVGAGRDGNGNEVHVFRMQKWEATELPLDANEVATLALRPPAEA